MEQDDENNIDLDTRIAMMFKEKSFGAAPPFLQLDDSESDTEKDGDRAPGTGDATAAAGSDNSLLDKIKTEMHVENSMDSMMQPGVHDAMTAISNDSNFGDNKLKIKQEKKLIEDGASDISSDDEVLESCTPPQSSKVSALPSVPGDIKLEDDKMSLSSLSSTEDKSNRKAIASEMDVHKNTVPSGMPEYYYPSSINPPYYYPNGENANMYDPYGGMSTQGYMQPYMSGFPAGLLPGNYVQSAEYPSKRSNEPVASASEPKKDPSEQIVSAVIERVKEELKQILKKDFNKRMIESIAYKKYETWWDEQAQNKNKPSTLV